MRLSQRVIQFSLAAILLSLSFSVEAQQPKKVPQIGYLSIGSSFRVNDEAFRQGLRQLGYIEGHNIVVEWRFVDAKSERYHDSAAELVHLKSMPL